jgi:hypothetical protein
MLAACICLGGLMGTVIGARGTTLARMSIEQMARSAQFVVRAHCVANSVAWDAGEIWTFTTFAVDEKWKGPDAVNPNSYVSVRLLGGTVGNLTSTVSGVPRFASGEEVVLFLERTARGDFSIVSWMQGTFRVRRDTRTGADIAIQDAASFETFEPSIRQFRAAGARNMQIDELRARVAAAISETASHTRGEK